MQLNAMSDVRIILIGGFQLPGLLTVSESGVTEDAIEVPENGKIRLIGSGIEKIEKLEVTYLFRRDLVTYLYMKGWRDSGKDARDLVMYYTDKSGKLENAYRRDVWASCELLDFKAPDFDQGARKHAQGNFSLAPYDYQTNSL